jgi:hypothetical protein
MTIRGVLVAIFALSGWILAGLQAFLLYNILFHPFDDPISLAGRHTKELLALHEKYDQTSEVIAWLDMYHGEAPGHQVMISFVHWAIDNTESAESLLARLQADPATTAQLAFAVTDGCQEKTFRTAFGQNTSSAVKTIITQIEHLQSVAPSSGCE